MAQTDPRENVIQFAFFYGIVGGKSKPVAKIDVMESLSEANKRFGDGY